MPGDSRTPGPHCHNVNLVFETQGNGGWRFLRNCMAPNNCYAAPMKIATYNVNGINSRLPRLLEWLEEARPDVACLQEIKTSDETFPIAAIEAAGYSRDLAWPEGLQRRRGAVARRRAARNGCAACPATRTTRTAATSKPACTA